jgi:hypothetical protein
MTPGDASVTLNPDVGVAEATLTIGVYGEALCRRVQGEACYWWFTWQRAPFDETLVCFRS